MSENEKEVQKGERLLAEFDYKGAISAFKKALKIDPKSAAAYFGLAEASIGEPKIAMEEVLEAYSKAIEFEPNNPFYRCSYGNFCLQVGKWGPGEEQYKKAAEIDPENKGQYYTEFGLEYYQAMLKQYEGELPAAMMKEVKKKSATYLLKSIDLEVEEAKNIL